MRATPLQASPRRLRSNLGPCDVVEDSSLSSWASSSSAPVSASEARSERKGTKRRLDERLALPRA